jgi:hypothetical protein
MARARVHRLATLIAGAILLIGGIGLVRSSRFAAPKGAVLIAIGVLLVGVAARPTRRRP